MSNKQRHKRKQSPQPRRFPWLWLAAGGLLLIIVGGLSIVRTSSNARVVAPEVTGTPRLAVDQTVIDEGYVKLNTMVRTAFRLRNIGDQPLHILGEPQVVLVEGC
jgi:cytochrome c-type biogenesis protein CcmH/NrfG